MPTRRQRAARAVLGAVVGVVAATSAPGARAADLTGDWRGEYACVQGVTGLTLRVLESGSRLRALFAFYAKTENPDVPSGCFEMSGRVIPRTNQVQFDGGKWLRRPPGWGVVDLRGVVDAAADSIAGRVSTSGCQDFRLTRVPADTIVDKLCAAPTQ